MFCRCASSRWLPGVAQNWCTAGLVRRGLDHARHTSEIPNEETPRKPHKLEGKVNWKELRQKRRMGHEKWQPTKRLTWYQIDHLKTLRTTQPDEWTLKKLADAFGISISAVTRILKSKFVPSDNIKERQDAAAAEQTRKRREIFLQKLGMVQNEDGEEMSGGRRGVQIHGNRTQGLEAETEHDENEIT